MKVELAIYISIISIVAILAHAALNMDVVIQNNAINKTAIISNEIDPYDTEYVYVKNRPSTAEKKVIKEGVNGLRYTYDGINYISLDDKKNEVVQIGTGDPGEFKGRLTGYGPDCPGCSPVGHVSCTTREGKSHSLTYEGVYYNDKDIRMNLVTMKLFNIFHSIWCENNFILKMPLYEVMTTSRNKGIIQLIPDTQTLDEMPIKETSGFKNLFGKRSLNKYLTLNSGISPEEVYDNFISTNVSYGVANLIIGVTQRNKKNLHFKKDGEIYYTSYEHLLNHYSKILGDRGVPFLFNITFVDFLTKLNKIKDFTDLFKKAFMLMRDKSKDIITLIEILVSSGLPEISNKSLHYMEDSLLLIKTQKEAENILDQILNSIMAKK